MELVIRSAPCSVKQFASARVDHPALGFLAASVMTGGKQWILGLEISKKSGDGEKKKAPSAGNNRETIGMHRLEGRDDALAMFLGPPQSRNNILFAVL